MATVQDMDDDGVVPMTNAEHLELVAKGVTYHDMTPAQRRSWDKKARLDTKRLGAEYREIYEKYLGKIEPFDPPPKNAKELLEMLRLKYKKDPILNILFQDPTDDESAVESVRLARGTYY